MVSMISKLCERVLKNFSKVSCAAKMHMQLVNAAVQVRFPSEVWLTAWIVVVCDHVTVVSSGDCSYTDSSFSIPGIDAMPTADGETLKHSVFFRLRQDAHIVLRMLSLTFVNAMSDVCAFGISPRKCQG